MGSENAVRGTLAAAVTPLTGADGTIDADGIDAVVEFYVRSGLDGILALGTTGEGILFSLDERLAMVRREVAHLDNGIAVTSFDSLLMDFAEREGASLIVRGLRAVADFEYEYQMAGMNQQINDRVETVFLMADVALQPIASRLVKEIAMYGGEIAKFVPPQVAVDVRARVAELSSKKQ